MPRTQARETEARIFRGGYMPFLKLSDDIGGFREIVMPGAFDKTLSESRRLPAISRFPCGLRFGTTPVRIEFQVIREVWKRHAATGELQRELVEVRLLSISRAEGGPRISDQARRIAEGVRRDFEAVKRKETN